MTEQETVETLSTEQVEALIADAPATDPCAFVPTDASGVDWVLSKIADARGRASRIRENAERMARAEERNAEALEWKYGAALQLWLKAELAGSDRKSKRLFHGVIGYRTRPAGAVVTDPAAALAWVRENLPGAVVESLDRKALTARLIETGEAPSGIILAPAEEVFYLR
jgi:hypothetical protein